MRKRNRVKDVKGKIAKAVSGARKRAQDKGNTKTESSALKQPLKQLREAGEQGLKKHGRKSWSNGVLNALINPPQHFRNNQQRVNWLNKQATISS
ncbi:hypothetical protein [Salinisphaera sp. G21_0]|uniref:hypothetical protein n=1 Tax=Salinisphaera sp. G21_0 TaxID=2821094 RepID=UPI001AD985B9|nr:hypothetical protein [Salinisphaera sp. G21_0]MBO9480730.1 hypothetical protein [Salinisphaera sp. G21_0]